MRNPLRDLNSEEFPKRLERILNAGRLAPVDINPWDSGESDREVVDLTELCASLRQSLDTAASPLQGALSVSFAVQNACPDRAPASERLIFMLAEDAVRNQARKSRGHFQEKMEPSCWCYVPGLALGSQGFRAWQPTTHRGLEDLVDGLRREVDHGLGAISVLRRWRDLAVSMGQGGHTRSRYPELLMHLAKNPILSIDDAAKEMGMTWHGARKLVLRARDEGLVAEITWRSSCRLWAVPWLAELMRSRSAGIRDMSRSGEPVLRTDESEPLKDQVQPRKRKSRHSIEEEESVVAVLEELDAAMKGVDDLLLSQRRPLPPSTS